MKFKAIGLEKYAILKCKEWAVRSIIQTKDGDLFISSNSSKIEEFNKDRNGHYNTYVLKPFDHNEWVRATFRQDEVKSIQDLTKPKF